MPTETGRPPASRAYARYVAILLASVTVLNVMDRQVISILIEPIKHELELSDAASFQPS